MISNYILILFGFCAGNVFGYTVQDAPLLVKRPSWLKVCKQSDPKINNCVNDMFLEMFPNLAAGIPEINVEHFEPLSLESVSISKGSGPIVLTGNFNDLNIVGPSNSTPKNTEFTKTNKHGHWYFGLDFPYLGIKSKYDLKGQILVLPLVGHGNCDLKLFDIRTNVSTNLTFTEKEGRQVMHIDSMKVKFKVGGIKIKFDNLFNGNKILGHTVNTFMNQNGLEIVDELEESLSESLAATFKKLINNVFVKIPLDLWYLSDEQYEEYEKELKDAKKS